MLAVMVLYMPVLRAKHEPALALKANQTHLLGAFPTSILVNLFG